MSQFITEVQKILLRDLDKLEKEIASYPNQESIWKVEKQIANSAGNLCLHLCGNLQHFIGAVVGKTGYVRDREKEFSSKDIPAKELVLQIIATKEAIRKTFAHPERIDLDAHYPIQVFDEPMTTRFFLMHLASHLNYHLGQVNYHRRLLA